MKKKHNRDNKINQELIDSGREAVNYFDETESITVNPQKKLIILEFSKDNKGIWEITAKPENLPDHIIGRGLTLQEADKDVLERSKKLGSYSHTVFPDA